MGLAANVGNARHGERARRASVVVLVAALGLVATGCLAAGTYQVSPTLQNGTAAVGLWHSLGPVNPGTTCWFTHDYLGPVPPAPPGAGARPIPGGASGQGPVWIEIPPGAHTFRTSGCFPFWQEPGPFARPLATPGQPFGPGYYKVGYEIAPGRYRAAGGTYTFQLPDGTQTGGSCSWTRLSNFQANPSSFIEFGQSSSVTISPTDVGFRSQGCGTWTKIG